MSTTLYASFIDPSHAERATGALLDHGVMSKDISVISSHTPIPVGMAVGVPDWRNERVEVEPTPFLAPATLERAGNAIAESGDKAAASVTGAVGAKDASANYAAAAERRSEVHYNEGFSRPEVITDVRIDTEEQAKTGISTTTAGDAGSGAVKGTVWGLGIGAVAALAALVVPGVGLVLGGGALASALGAIAASAGAGAAAGAVAGYLKDQGADDEVANHYASTVTGGGAVIAIALPSGNCGETEARQVLTKYGATNITTLAPALVAA